MGFRGRKSRTQRKHFVQSRENNWKSSNKNGDSDEQQQNAAITDNNKNNRENSNPTWQRFATQNLAFDEYYKEQEIVPPEEWNTFVDCLRSPLPAAFRINSSSQCYLEIRSKVENDFVKSLQEEGTDGSEVEAIRPLPWYPENLAWQSNFSRQQLRKNQILGRFHEFLKLQNEIGNITRQEAVSMVPPLFLDVRPDDFVLDMCAAPGSKTFQLLEMIHHSAEPGSLPGGMVLANDADVQRCNLLIHQTKRMSTANLIVTNHEAQHFPSCHLNRSYAKGSEPREAKGLDIDQLLFDRVLCDVPCSGDGTLRKAPDIWRRWNAGMGNGLHGLQIQIAMRGMSLLKVGGRMVYSTCSMNPIENEAVVAEILRCGGSVELVDVSGELPQLVRRPGLKKWKVKDKGMWLTSYKEVCNSRRAAVVPGMFPSGNVYVDAPEHGDDASRSQLPDNGSNSNSQNGIGVLQDPTTPTTILDEEASSLPLERCVRIVPHDQNTGAFFIAVFHKISPLPVIQKKPFGQPGKTTSRGNFQAQTFTEVKDINADEVEQVDSVDNRISEVTMDDDDILENGKDEAPPDTDPSKIVDEKRPEQIEPPSDGRSDPELVTGKRKLQMQGKWKGIDPVIFYQEEVVVDQIKAFYGIKESFPFKGHLIVRNVDINHVKRVYYVSKSVKEVLDLNFLAGQQLKIAAVGLKMFERQKSKDAGAFRITSEGLPLLLPHITKQILYASPVDFKHLLQHKSLKFGDFEDAKFRENASKLQFGCCVVVLNKDNKTLSEPQVDASTIAIGCWRGRNSITVMVTELDIQELLQRMLMYMEENADNKPLTDEADKIVKAHEAEFNILKNNETNHR
nr:PREDICTED: tRNA (cytosine(34)-C(5))-methyltransferase-like [Nicotiana tabacum]